MPSPLAVAGLSLGASKLLGMLFPEQYGGRSDILDPRKFMDKMTMSDAEKGQERSLAMRDIGAAMAKPTADIKQAGAAGRLPSGATSSALAGVAQAGGQAAATVGPALEGEQRRSFGNFFRTALPFEHLRAGQVGAEANRNQAFVGALSRIAMLWQSGAFKPPEGQDQNMTEILDFYGIRGDPAQQVSRGEQQLQGGYRYAA